MISDTHQVDGEEVIRAIDDNFSDVDTIIHCGDVVEMEVLEALKAVAPLIVVAGNMDTREIKNIYPKKEVIETNGKRLGIVHGWGSPHGILSKILFKFRTDNVDAILFGHTHQPMNEMKDGMLLFNPGSLLDRVYTNYNSLGILEVTTAISGRIVEITL